MIRLRQVKQARQARQARQMRQMRESELGFTMTELLIGTFLASVISLGVFAVFADSSAYYSRQLDRTQAQSSLRFAMEYIKGELHDFGRLSILSTAPQVRDPNYCGARAYQGISLIDNDPGSGFYQPSATLVANDIYPDRLQLLIDASDATPLRVAQQTGTQITLLPMLSQPTSEARLALSIGAEQRFERVFDNQSLTRITNLSTGRYDLVPTNGAQLVNGAGTLTLTAPPCQDLGCQSGDCVVNSVHWVEYLILTGDDHPEHTFLARRRLRLNNGSPINGSELMIGDHVVNLQIWGLYDTKGQAPNNFGPFANLASIIPDDLDLRDDRGNWTPDTDESNRVKFWAHRLRSLNLMVSARAARVDPNLRMVQDLNGLGAQERATIRLERSPERGLAHVSSMVGAVDTANLYRGD